MAHRWTYRGMIDGEIDLSPEQWRAAERRMVELSSRSPRMVWSIILVLAAAVTLCGLSTRPLVRMAQRQFRVDRTAAVLIVTIPMFVVISLTSSLIFWRMYRRAMRQALSEMGHEVCINCGHLLRGLLDDSNNCPECGHPRTSSKVQSPHSASEKG